MVRKIKAIAAQGIFYGVLGIGIFGNSPFLVHSTIQLLKHALAV
jgi:hypothetical protein